MNQEMPESPFAFDKDPVNAYLDQVIDEGESVHVANWDPKGDRFCLTLIALQEALQDQTDMYEEVDLMGAPSECYNIVYRGWIKRVKALVLKRYDRIAEFEDEFAQRVTPAWAMVQELPGWYPGEIVD